MYVCTLRHTHAHIHAHSIFVHLTVLTGTLLKLLFWADLRSRETQWSCFNVKKQLVVKNPPANARDIETQVRSLGWEDALRRAWQPTPVFLPGESHGQRSLGGYSPLGCKELNTTETTQHARMCSTLPALQRAQIFLEPR